MIRPHRIQLLNLVAKRHRLVYDELQELVRRGLSGEERELRVHRSGPGDDDANCNLGRSKGLSNEGRRK